MNFCEYTGSWPHPARWSPGSLQQRIEGVEYLWLEYHYFSTTRVGFEISGKNEADKSNSMNSFDELL